MPMPTTMPPYTLLSSRSPPYMGQMGVTKKSRTTLTSTVATAVRTVNRWLR